MFSFSIFLLTHIRGIRPENEIQKWRTLEKVQKKIYSGRGFKTQEQVEFEIRKVELGDAWLAD